MPYQDPDPNDPMTLHGVEIETDSAEANREMAACFVEEYLRLGFSPEKILKIFQTTGYAGPNLVYRMFGREKIEALINDYAALRGPRLKPPMYDRKPNGDTVLPVLD